MRVEWNDGNRVQFGRCPIAGYFKGQVLYWLTDTPLKEPLVSMRAWALDWSNRPVERARIVAYECLTPNGWTAGNVPLSSTLDPSILSIDVLSYQGYCSRILVDNLIAPAAPVLCWKLAERRRPEIPSTWDDPEPPALTHRQHLTLALRLAIQRLDIAGQPADDLRRVLEENGSKKV